MCFPSALLGHVFEWECSSAITFFNLPFLYLYSAAMSLAMVLRCTLEVPS